nr:olfactory receptor 4P4-like [Cherax quadricarinatus]
MSGNSKYIIYLTLCSLTMLECVVTLFINVTDKTLRAKPSTAFGNSLLSSIFVLSAISFACNLFFVVFYNTEDYKWCSIALGVCLRYFHAVTNFNLTCLALDRYVAICWPLHYSRMLTKARCYLLCLACWITPCFLLLLLPCGSQLTILCLNGKVSMKFLIAYTVVYTLAVLATFVFYVLVAVEFRRESRGHSVDTEKTERLLRTRTAVSAMKVLVLYVLLALPHTIYPLVSRSIVDKPPVLRDVFHIINRIYLLFFLPIYAWTNAPFKQALCSRRRTLLERLSSLVVWLFFNGPPQMRQASEESSQMSCLRSSELERHVV